MTLKASKGMSIDEFASKKYCFCGKELEPFNLNLCNECLAKELIFRRKEFRKLVYQNFDKDLKYRKIKILI